MWAQQTNINFVVVPDNGAAEGSGPDEQGSPGFGDIRIGGYNFGSSTLALTYQPPSANNFSIAGDMTFNTGQAFNENTTYDLFTVAMHEFGHALGLGESSVANAVEYATYTARKTALASDDIAGIESIYSNGGSRTHDAYNVNGASNGTLSTAASINSAISATSLTALIPNLDITTAGQLEYFTFTAPAGSGSTLELDVQSSGLSLLAPKFTLYGSNGTTSLGSVSGAGQYGTTLSLSVSGVTPGEKFTVEVQGADTTQMGTGRYALGLSFNGTTPPLEASPVVAVAAGSPEHAGSGQADGSSYLGYGIGCPVIAGISPDNGVSASDGITNSQNISLNGSAPANDIVTIYDDGVAIGQTVSLFNNTWTYNNPSLQLAAGIYFFTASARDFNGYSTASSAPYEVTIDTHTPGAPHMNDISPDTGASSTDGITNDNTPTFSGTTEPFAVINLYANGSSTPFGTTEADITGNWSFTVGQAGAVTYPRTTGTTGILPILLILPGQTSTSTLPSILADGTYDVTATAMDIAGTTGPSSSVLKVVIDTQAPAAPVITGVSNVAVPISPGSTVTTQQQTISGTAQAGTTLAVMLNGVLAGDTTVGTNGVWSYSPIVPLASGTYTITARATDLAGNVSAVSAPFTATIHSLAAPSLSGVSLVNTTTGMLFFTTTQQSLSLIGTSFADANVKVYLNGTAIGTTTADASGNWSYSYVPSSSSVANGTYSFSAVSSDSYGNISAMSGRTPFVVGGGLTAATPTYSSGTLSGVATANTIVIIVDGNTVIGYALANAEGTWHFTPTLSKGKHSIMVSSASESGSGDVGLLSSALSITV
jgi:hypothetical protein